MILVLYIFFTFFFIGLDWEIVITEGRDIYREM
ncbi:preprotein translocase subunit SecE [Paenibacillus sp. BK720]|nr:preprotein translocase subunit SecE [Paenibacillus sp. BK720]